MRNALYADVAPLFVGADGVIRAPAGPGRVAWVAPADVAHLAVVLLTEPGHEGQIYDVSGLHAIDLHETGEGIGDQPHHRTPHRSATDVSGRAPRRRTAVRRAPGRLSSRPGERRKAHPAG